MNEEKKKSEEKRTSIRGSGHYGLKMNVSPKKEERSRTWDFFHPNYEVLFPPEHGGGFGRRYPEAETRRSKKKSYEQKSVKPSIDQQLEHIKEKKWENWVWVKGTDPENHETINLFDEIFSPTMVLQKTDEVTSHLYRDFQNLEQLDPEKLDELSLSCESVERRIEEDKKLAFQQLEEIWKRKIDRFRRGVKNVIERRRTFLKQVDLDEKLKKPTIEFSEDSSEKPFSKLVLKCSDAFFVIFSFMDTKDLLLNLSLSCGYFAGFIRSNIHIRVKLDLRTCFFLNIELLLSKYKISSIEYFAADRRSNYEESPDTPYSGYTYRRRGGYRSYGSGKRDWLERINRNEVDKLVFSKLSRVITSHKNEIRSLKFDLLDKVAKRFLTATQIRVRSERCARCGEYHGEEVETESNEMTRLDQLKILISELFGTSGNKLEFLETKLLPSYSFHDIFRNLKKLIFPLQLVLFSEDNPSTDDTDYYARYRREGMDPGMKELKSLYEQNLKDLSDLFVNRCPHLKHLDLITNETVKKLTKTTNIYISERTRVLMENLFDGIARGCSNLETLYCPMFNCFMTFSNEFLMFISKLPKIYLYYFGNDNFTIVNESGSTTVQEIDPLLEIANRVDSLSHYLVTREESLEQLKQKKNGRYVPDEFHIVIETKQSIFQYIIPRGLTDMAIRTKLRAEQSFISSLFHRLPNVMIECKIEDIHFISNARIDECHKEEEKSSDEDDDDDEKPRERNRYSRDDSSRREGGGRNMYRKYSYRNDFGRSTDRRTNGGGSGVAVRRQSRWSDDDGNVNNESRYAPYPSRTTRSRSNRPSGKTRSLVYFLSNYVNFTRKTSRPKTIKPLGIHLDLNCGQTDPYLGDPRIRKLQRELDVLFSSRNKNLKNVWISCNYDKEKRENLGYRSRYGRYDDVDAAGSVDNELTSFMSLPRLLLTKRNFDENSIEKFRLDVFSCWKTDNLSLRVVNNFLDLDVIPFIRDIGELNRTKSLRKERRKYGPNFSSLKEFILILRADKLKVFRSTEVEYLKRNGLYNPINQYIDWKRDETNRRSGEREDQEEEEVEYDAIRQFDEYRKRREKERREEECKLTKLDRQNILDFFLYDFSTELERLVKEKFLEERTGWRRIVIRVALGNLSWMNFYWCRGENGIISYENKFNE